MNNRMPQITVVLAIDHVSTSHEREQLQLDAADFSVLESVFHEKEREVDRWIRVLKREQEKLRVLEARDVVLLHEPQCLRSYIQSGKDAMAVAVRDLYESQQQLKRRRL